MHQKNSIRMETIKAYSIKGESFCLAHYLDNIFVPIVERSLKVESWQLDFFLIRLKRFAIHPSSFFSLRRVDRRLLIYPPHWFHSSSIWIGLLHGQWTIVCVWLKIPLQSFFHLWSWAVAPLILGHSPVSWLFVFFNVEHSSLHWTAKTILLLF